MKHLTILITLALMGCNSSSIEREQGAIEHPVAEAEMLSLPSGFSVIEQQPDGYFIRVASSSAASLVEVRSVMAAIGSRYDRIDFCTVSACARGDEYLSVIGRTVYDYEHDIIFSLDNFR